jgi:hypothetical protein
MSEAEAQATRFTVDHYEPKNAQPDLINAYDKPYVTITLCTVVTNAT